MAEAISLTEAARVLSEHFGGRLEADHSEGVKLMADALRERFDLAPQDARSLVERLEQAHSIRWMRGGETDAAPTTPANPTGNLYSSGTPTGGAPAAVPTQRGYWQL